MVLLKSDVIRLISLLRFFKLAKVLELYLRLFESKITPSVPLLSSPANFFLLRQPKFSNNHHNSSTEEQHPPVNHGGRATLLRRYSLGSPVATALSLGFFSSTPLSTCGHFLTSTSREAQVWLERSRGPAAGKPRLFARSWDRSVLGALSGGRSGTK